MTQQDDITQRVLTDADIEALAKKHIAPHADRLDKLLPHRVPYQQTEQFRRVKALIGDVLSKLRAPAPDGWRLVPVEPNEAMLDAGCKQHRCEQGDPWYSSPDLREGDCRDIYAAMLTAAPAAPGVSTVEDQAKPNGQNVGQIVDEYIQEYELRGEDEEGRDGVYSPNETERYMIADAIYGLLAEPEFIAAIAGMHNAPAAGDALDAARYRALHWLAADADRLQAVMQACSSRDMAEYTSENLNALADAALAALASAPVADERAQHDDWYSRTHMHEYSRDATWRGWQAHAALASVPVVDEHQLNAAVEAIQFALSADEGMEWLRCWNEGDFEACRREWPETPEACFIGADPLHPGTKPLASPESAPVADEQELRAAAQATCDALENVARFTVKSLDVRDALVAASTRLRAALASAPVAGEALTAESVERQYRDGVHIGSGLPRATCPCGFCAKHRHGFERGDDLAAPQASAENLRNAALEEAAALADSIGDALNKECQCERAAGADQVADAIRALKQPQADKDGGQQRAGDAFPAKPLPVFSAGKWTWSETGQAFSHTEMDEAAFVVYRAALSAPQAEQGERDA